MTEAEQTPASDAGAEDRVTTEANMGGSNVVDLFPEAPTTAGGPPPLPERITLEDAEGMVKATAYCRFPGTNMTVCCLTLQNGYPVTGESNVIRDEHFNEELGRKYARQMAIEKVLMLEGFRLKDAIFMEDQMNHVRALGLTPVEDEGAETASAETITEA